MPTLTEMQQTMRDRLAELEPLVAEHAELRGVLHRWEALDGSGPPAPEPPEATPTPAPTPAPAPARPRVPAAQRREEVLRLIAERPMIDAPDLAEALDLPRPRIVQLTSELQAEGLVRRSGPGFLVEAAAGDDTESGPQEEQHDEDIALGEDEIAANESIQSTPPAGSEAEDAGADG